MVRKLAGAKARVSTIEIAPARFPTPKLHGAGIATTNAFFMVIPDTSFQHTTQYTNWNIDAFVALGKTSDGYYKHPTPLCIKFNGFPSVGIISHNGVFEPVQVTDKEF